MGKGRPPTVSDEEILEAIHGSELPFVFTEELRDELGFKTNNGIQQRLEVLHDEGFVNVKRGTNANGWWLTEEGRDRVEGVT